MIACRAWLAPTSSGDLLLGMFGYGETRPSTDERQCDGWLMNSPIARLVLSDSTSIGVEVSVGAVAANACEDARMAVVINNFNFIFLPSKWPATFAAGLLTTSVHKHLCTRGLSGYGHTFCGSNCQFERIRARHTREERRSQRVRIRQRCHNRHSTNLCP